VKCIVGKLIAKHWYELVKVYCATLHSLHWDIRINSVLALAKYYRP